MISLNTLPYPLSHFVSYVFLKEAKRSTCWDPLLSLFHQPLEHTSEEQKKQPCSFN